MSDPPDRLINLFGALALGVADRVRWAALKETKLGGETAAALVVIGHAPGLSIDQLRQVLRLSHPGTVRLVERLTSAGLVVRSKAPHDRRTAAVCLTEAGQRQQDTLLQRRHAALTTILRAIEPEDRIVVERALETMLETLPDDAASALTVCRFCDVEQCSDCPMDTFGALG